MEIKIRNLIFLYIEYNFAIKCDFEDKDCSRSSAEKRSELILDFTAHNRNVEQPAPLHRTHTNVKQHQHTLTPLRRGFI